MASVYLLRHGEADYGPIRERGWPGATADLAPLSWLGRQQALAAAAGLSTVGATAIVSSPMTRALETASLVASRLGLLVQVAFDLHEWLPDDTFGWRDQAQLRAAQEDFDRCGGEWPPGERRAWEPLSAVRARATAALQASVAALAAGDVLIAACHEMVIRAMTGEPHTGTGQWRKIELPAGQAGDAQAAPDGGVRARGAARAQSDPESNTR
jgi:broad specificity phosphatase PhoE